MIVLSGGSVKYYSQDLIEQKLETLLSQKRNIHVIGFDDAPFVRGSNSPVFVAGIVCAGTRFDGMLWGQVHSDGWDATQVLSEMLLKSKFFPQLHLVLLDGIGMGGFNLINLPLLAHQVQLPCVAVMRRLPNFEKIQYSMAKLPDFERRWQVLQQAGEIHSYPPFYFQVSGASSDLIARVLQRLTDRGNVPEALRLAHLIASAVMKGESGKQA